MEKLFERNKAKQQQVTSHSDVDFVIDKYTVDVTSHAITTPTPTPTPQTNPNPADTEQRNGRKIHKAQPALGILKYFDPHLEHALQQIHPHHVHEIPEDSSPMDHRDRAEKKERKSFWDGIIRDRDRDKDKERVRDKERETREKEKEREKDKEGRDRLWREEDNPSELKRMIGYLTSTSSEDWTLVLEVSDRTSATEANAKEAVKALRRELIYAEPKSQLSAATLWEIMLRNASDILLTQISSRTFIDTLKGVLTSSRTSPVVRERLMEVLAAAASITSSRPYPSLKSQPSPFVLNGYDCDRNSFRALWMRLKLAEKPDVGMSFDTEDNVFNTLAVPTRLPVEEFPSSLSPAHLYYDSPPQFVSTSALPAPPPPPMGPRSPKLSSPASALDSKSPIQPSAKAFGGIVEEVNDEQRDLSDSPELRQQYFSLSEADDAIQKAIHAQLDDAPLRLLDTTSGLLCDREAQICAFKLSTKYKELLSLIIKHADIQMERIKEAVAFYFRFVMLSHRWEGKELLLRDIKDKAVYKLDPVGGIMKLQSFCQTARGAGYLWAWIDTCCIDQKNNVELQKSLNSMFDWYRYSALTMVYLSDVPPSSKSGALAKSAWNTRGWTVPEFLAPKIVLFYQKDWTLYLDDGSPNHKESATIMQELEDATGIDTQALIDFRPGMTVEEDIAYSLFGIFGVHLPILYGEKKQKALGRLLQEIVAQSGDITALDWVGKSSEFNSCLPADITSYKALPSALPFLSEEDIQTSVSWLKNAVDIDVALKLYSLLDNLGAPRFANRRLHLPCIAFTVTQVRRRRAQDQEGYFAYEVKADGLRRMLITTEDKLTQFSREKPTLQTFLLVRPWHPYLLELPDFADNRHRSMSSWSVSDSLSVVSSESGSIGLQSGSRALRLIVRLGQPFSAFLLARQRSGEYKRIASDHDIIAQVEDVAGSVYKMMDVRTLEIL